MDEELRSRIRRIEGKIDAVLGLVLLALGFWCADRIAALLNRSFGWNRDGMFFVAAFTLYLVFVFWYGNRIERR